MRDVLERLMEGHDLTEQEAGDLLVHMTDERTPPARAGALLATLRVKGETPAEVRGFAKAMRQLARKPIIPDDTPAVDIVGTGGDGSGSLNISTGTALLTAACGQPVVKHGNQAISSKSGSADVLDALGLELPLDEESAGRCLEVTGFTFLFAPYFHPAMKTLAPVRRALGVRTVFNVLGPLTNPAAPPFALIGAFSVGTAELLAQALADLPLERAFVVHGAPCWDEATPVGPFILHDVRPGRVTTMRRVPSDLGFSQCRPEDLAGGSAAHNAERIRAAFGGERGPHRDTLVLGSALSLELTGAAATPVAAVEAAGAAIDSGAAARLLRGLAEFSHRNTRTAETKGA